MSPEQIDRLTTLAIIDALLSSSAKHWEKRARDFDAVGTPDCDAIARACRNKATLCRDESADEWAELLALELGDVA